MKIKSLLFIFLTLSFFATSCGSGGGGGGGSDSGATAAEDLPAAVHPKVQIYSASGLGVNIITQFDTEGNFIGCTLVANDTGEAIQVNASECQAFVDEVQRPPGAFCQVLLDNTSMLSLEPSKCTRMVADGQILPAADDSAKRAATHADLILKYWLEHHNRKGLDNQDSDNVSVVHIGQRWNNAAFFPDIRVMVYGDGDGENSRDFTLAADIAAHEMTHGVVAYTARLVYQSESGALDEGTADFFGKVATGPGNWILGEAVDISGFLKRDLANPSHFTGVVIDANGQPVRRPHPAHVSEMAFPLPGAACDSTNDNCYVHFNSTVPSHASYLMAQALGLEKAEKIYYLALTQFFTPFTNFQGAANAMLLACQQLYTPVDCDKVSASWAEVGLTPNAN